MKKGAKRETPNWVMMTFYVIVLQALMQALQLGVDTKKPQEKVGTIQGYEVFRGVRQRRNAGYEYETFTGFRQLHTTEPTTR